MLKGGDMTRARERTDTTGSAETAFEGALRQAAQAMAPSRAASGLRFHPGKRLLDGRLRIRRRIGEGGMGVVYEAEDLQRGAATVALKTLSRVDPAGVYRLKGEFRSLAELRHPGVCHLYELFCEGEQWFFTMELVQGVRFDRWLRPHGELREARARAAFARLCEGIAAIHGAGKLHRDLKPSNVLVSDTGRVVVLDFGLAMAPESDGINQTVSDHRISGTPAYMAPEQAAGASTSTASDLYALGVMLFEALTGELPFTGRVGEILAAKQRELAPPVHSKAPAAASDLAALCDALLAREPALRPSIDEVRAALGSGAEPQSVSRSVRPPAEQEPLLGREGELSELRAAYQATLAGQPVVLFVAGESGIGKSALVGCFLDELRAEGCAALLAGRCYEQESVPFKAFDALVDDLSRFLRKLTREAAGDLMPREVSALARLFPVLERVSAVAEAPSRELLDPQELQQRAFAAFGELLARIRDRRPLVLYIDDLQWTCRDSTVCMSALFALPEPPPLLVIASHRSEGAADNPLLQRTFAAARANHRFATRSLELRPLPLAATTALAERLLAPARAQQARGIAQEAHGSPFFVAALVRQQTLSDSEGSSLTLQEAVLRHVAVLDSGPRLLMELLAVAGRPLPAQLALDAAGVAYDTQDVLLSERLARVASGSKTRTLCCYHDKIREGLTAALSAPRLRELHGRLARALSSLSAADPEHLALHFEGAGEPALAAVHYERAGDASARALAFEYAAEQYERALQLGELAVEHRRALCVKRGEALASAGRSRDAAGMYRIAAGGAPPAQALELKRRSAHLLMTSGYVDEGRELLGEVLAAIGLSLPGSRRTAIAQALWSRLRLSLRGLEPRTAGGSRSDDDVEARLGGLWTVVQGSVGNDPFLMVEMSARYAQLALDSGREAHAARALGMEAYMVSFDGAATRTRNEKLLAQAARLATRAGDPAVIGWVKQVRGCALIHEGRFAEGRTQIADALDWLEQRCTSVPFELAGVRVYGQNAALHLGELAETSLGAPALVEDARRRGDMYQSTLLATGFALPALLAHRGPVDAERRFDEARLLCQPQSSYQWSDYMLLAAELSLGLYQRSTAHGLSLLDQQWQALQRSQLLRMHIARALLLYLAGGCSLALVRQGGAQRAERERTRKHIRGLKGTGVAYAQGFAAVLEAGLSLADGQQPEAERALRTAVASLDAAGMRMYAASARLRLGQLLRGEEGRALMTSAEDAMAVEAVLDPDATAEMLAPGCR